MTSDRDRVLEHQCFQQMTDSIEIAAACAKRMGLFRPDQKYQWEKMAEVWGVAREAIFRLAGERAVKS